MSEQIFIRKELIKFERGVREQIEREIVALLFMDGAEGNTIRILDEIWDMERNFNYESDSLDDPFCLFDDLNLGALFSEVWKMKARGEKADPVSVVEKIGEKHNIDLGYIGEIINGGVNTNPENIVKDALILLGAFWKGKEFFE